MMLRSSFALLGLSALAALGLGGRALPPACGGDSLGAAPLPVVSLADSSWAALFNGGQSFPDFLDAAKRRREGWLAITAGVQVADSMVERAQKVGGDWRLIAVAIDACGDSMQQVPYVAKLAELVPGLSFRIVLPTDGEAVQDANRALDGRKTTPTYVLLNVSGEATGCVVEFPRELRHWNFARRDSLSSAVRHEYMAEWYLKNKGAGIVAEVVEMMEAAAARTPMCERGPR